MRSFQCLYHQPVFQKKQLLYLRLSLAILMWYFTEDLNLLALFDRNVGLTTNCAMMKVLENVVEEESLSQTRVDMTTAKNKTLVECVTKNCRKLICLTNQLKIFHRAASKIFSGCLFSTSILLLLIETQLPSLKITSKHQALLWFGRALRLLQESLNFSVIGSKTVISRLKKKPSW